MRRKKVKKVRATRKKVRANRKSRRSRSEKFTSSDVMRVANKLAHEHAGLDWDDRLGPDVADSLRKIIG